MAQAKAAARSPVRDALDEAEARIARETEERVLWYAEHPGEISARLAALDAEWDLERTLAASAAGAVLAGLGLGMTGRRTAYVLPIAAGGFLLQHALVGWSLPDALLRRMGVRKRAEIERERYALKALRGDFEGTKSTVRQPGGAKAARAAES